MQSRLMNTLNRCIPSAVVIALSALPALWIGCTPDNPLSLEQLDSAAGAPCGELTYENFAADFFWNYCLPCHNEQLIGDIDRTDAPNGINFNSLDGIREFQKRIRLRAAVQGDMPPALLPVDKPSEEERQELLRWLDCGAP